MTLVYVALGAALGAPLRLVVSHLLDGRLPWGTLLVNVAGSSLLGLFSGLALEERAVAFLGVGFCGALTTWSSLAVQSVDRGARVGGGYVAATVALALTGCAAGFALGSALG